MRPSAGGTPRQNPRLHWPPTFCPAFFGGNRHPGDNSGVYPFNAMKTNSLFLAGSLLATVFAGCAYPPTPVVVAPPPPPPAAPAEVVGVPPAPGYFWVRGHYAWRYGRYVWVRGRWVARVAGVWIDGHYENRGGAYVWIEGHWR